VTNVTWAEALRIVIDGLLRPAFWRRDFYILHSLKVESRGRLTGIGPSLRTSLNHL
jgi:hypothetical protein